MSNHNGTSRFSAVLWGGLGLVLIGTVGAFLLGGRQTTSSTTVATSGAKPLPVLRTLGAFQLTNQLGAAVTLAQLRGKVWIGDIIFTRCPGPCAQMTRQYAELQRELAGDKGIGLFTLTADPTYDTVPVLQAYAEKYGSDATRWWFLTGTKKEIYTLAMEGLLLAVDDIKPEDRQNVDDLFIHTTSFVLVDKQGRMRGIYESTDPAKLQQLLKDAFNLADEK